MDELDETEGPTVGERLRAAREEKGLSLEEVAAQTRIPRRHLESLERADWEQLPAPTYTIGFAKSYALAVDLDRTEIGEQLRTEMGGSSRALTTTTEVFEPADPARTMPRWLVLAAIAAVILVIAVMTWLNNRSLQGGDEGNQQAATAPTTQAPARAAAPTSAPQPAATGPVVITATAPAWLRVTDQGKKLVETTLQPGQTYQVPQTAVAPLLRIGAPEAIRITVGSAAVPQVGPSGQVKSNVSLKAADLAQAGQAAGPAGAAAPSAPPGQ